MKSRIKTYNTEEFRKEYLNHNEKLNELFEKSLEDFFCLRIEDVMEGVLKPIKPSREESHTLIYITESSYRTKIGFKEYEIMPESILVIQAGTVFSTDHINKKIKGFACHFHPNILIGKFGNRSLISTFEFLNPGSYPIIKIKENSRSSVQNLFSRLVTEFGKGTEQNLDIIHTYLHTLLTELRILLDQTHLVMQSAAYRITSELQTLAHKKVKQNLKVVDFASIMKVSPNHLNKSVKIITSKPASEVIDEIKLIEIKYMLYQSDLTISEISYEMGYLDPSYFTRFFKKRTGSSPTQYRKMIEKS